MQKKNHVFLEKKNYTKHWSNMANEVREISLRPKMPSSLRYSRRKAIWKSIKKTVDEKYLDDLLLLPRFWSVHVMDTLLSHVAPGVTQLIP